MIHYPVLMRQGFIFGIVRMQCQLRVIMMISNLVPLLLAMGCPVPVDVFPEDNIPDTVVEPDHTSVEDEAVGTYDDDLERLMTDCASLFLYSWGTCGSHLYILESTGFIATTSYYDADTGIIVAKRFRDDIGTDRSLFGSVDCVEDAPIERIICSEQ